MIREPTKEELEGGDPPIDFCPECGEYSLVVEAIGFHEHQNDDGEIVSFQYPIGVCSKCGYGDSQKKEELKMMKKDPETLDVIAPRSQEEKDELVQRALKESGYDDE